VAGTPGSASASEEQALYEAVTRYLDAEVRQDLPEVFRCLAPSSFYRASHDWDAYLAEALASSVRIRGYKILRITSIQENHDPKAFPKVEKFARVEVDVEVFYADTNSVMEVNYDFTFLKEGGRWYKG
jgi:hypothetical protein